MRFVLKHKLNENSYFKGLCKTYEQRSLVAFARAAIEDVHCISSNRRQKGACVDEVENNAGGLENE